MIKEEIRQKGIDAYQKNKIKHCLICKSLTETDGEFCPFCCMKNNRELVI